MKVLTSNQRLGNSIVKMRRNYSRMVIAVSNFNKVQDQANAARSMTQANTIHRILLSYEETYYANY